MCDIIACFSWVWRMYTLHTGCHSMAAGFGSGLCENAEGVFAQRTAGLTREGGPQ